MKTINNNKIKVGITNGHTIFRQGLESLIQQEDDMEIVGGASDDIETLRLVESKTPNVLIMDTSMPNLNGIDLSKRIKENFTDTRIIILSIYSEQEYIHELFSCGVYAYLSKESIAQDLISAIRAVHKGYFYLSPSVSEKVINRFLMIGEGKNNIKQTSQKPLTKRENEILQLIANGYTSREIGEMTNTSKKTVDTHRNNIMKKLDIHRKTELIKYAIEHGLIRINIRQNNM